MRRLTTEDYKKRVYDKHGDEYTVLGEYRTSKDFIKVRHNTCGKVYDTVAEYLYSGGCEDCGYLKTKTSQRHTTGMFKEYVLSAEGSEYKVLGEYVNNTTKIKILHESCGSEYLVTPRDFKSGRRCPECKGERISKGVNKDHAHFLKILGDSLSEDYEILTEYVNARTHMVIKHHTCGEVFEMRPHKILGGQRCYRCRRGSIGESEVRNWLVLNNIQFEEQKTFPDLKLESFLMYDFAITNGSKVEALVEYNGKQHYEPIDYFGGIETFRIQQKRDEMKKEYARKNNIPLITVRYDEDVDEVLSKLIPR